MHRKYNIAVIGATGSVGGEVLKSLAEREFPIKEIYAIASHTSLGREVTFGEKTLKISTIDNIDIKNIDIAFFCTSSEVAKKYIPEFTANRCLCIDKSSYFRSDPNVALIIPEINADAIGEYKNKNIIASPNCCAIPIAMVLEGLMQHENIKRVVVATYQSTSGAGKDAMEELYKQTKSKYIFQTAKPAYFPKVIAFNLFPHIGDFLADGSTSEEEKVVNEIRKVLKHDFKLSITCVRVPVFVGHSMAVNIEFENDFKAKEVESILSKAEGINVISSKSSAKYLTPVEVVGEDQIYVSRIRNEKNENNIINLWITCDNLRKGAALNAVQIAEHYIGEI